MLTDATGVVLAIGDRVGTITGGQNHAVVTGEIVRIGAVMITVKVKTSVFVGEPSSGYARRPQVGFEHRLYANRVFRLGPQRQEEEG